MDISTPSNIQSALQAGTGLGKMTAYLMPGPMPTELPTLADLINNALGVVYVGGAAHGAGTQPLIRMSVRDEAYFATIGYWPGASYTASTGDKFVVPKTATVNCAQLVKFDQYKKSWTFMNLQSSHRLDYDKTGQGMYTQPCPLSTANTLFTAGDYVEYDFGAPVALTSIILRNPTLAAGVTANVFNLQAFVAGAWQDLAGDISSLYAESVNPVVVTTNKIRFVFKTVSTSSGTSWYGLHIHFKGDYLPAVVQDDTRTIGYVALVPCNYTSTPPTAAAATGVNLVLNQLADSLMQGHEYFGLGFEVGSTVAQPKEVFIPGAVTRNGAADVRPQSWIINQLTVKGTAL